MKKEIVIDFLYLDLHTCERCIGVSQILEEVLPELEELGYKVTLNKINVNTEELAYFYKFKSSPTIRVNGNDIQVEIKENKCKSCGSICDSEVDCRIWIYNGVEYTIPPKEFIIEEILKALIVDRPQEQEEVFILPENLKRFYKAKKYKKLKLMR